MANENPAQGWLALFLSWMTGAFGHFADKLGHVTLADAALAASLIFTILQIMVSLARLYRTVRPAANAATDHGDL